MAIEKKQFPYDVFGRKYKYYLLLLSETIISEEQNSVKESFHDFLNNYQGNEIVSIINSNGSELMDLDYSKYDDLIENYYINKQFSKIHGITESPDLRLLSKDKKWEYYSNTVFNLSILGFSEECKDLIKTSLCNIENRPFIYISWEDYYTKNRQMFKNSKKILNELNLSYSPIFL